MLTDLVHDTIIMKEKRQEECKYMFPDIEKLSEKVLYVLIDP